MPVRPNLFIAGAPRCVTSSLHAWLQEIPGIYRSRIKEPNYFSRQVIGDGNPLVKPIRDAEKYLQLFSGAANGSFMAEIQRGLARLENLLGRRLPWRNFGMDSMSASVG